MRHQTVARLCRLNCRLQIDSQCVSVMRVLTHSLTTDSRFTKARPSRSAARLSLPLAQALSRTHSRRASAYGPSPPPHENRSNFSVQVLTYGRNVVPIDVDADFVAGRLHLDFRNDSMTYAEMLLPEFDQEMASTRKVLERLPDDKFDWQAHPKSHTIGWNANHVVDIVNWLVQTLTKPSLDIAPVGGPRVRVPEADEQARAPRSLRPKRDNRAQGDHGDQGRGHERPLEPVAGRQAILHNAALGRGPQCHPQPPDAPSRPPMRLPPTKRHPRPRPVRPLRRRRESRMSPALPGRQESAESPSQRSKRHLIGRVTGKRGRPSRRN